MIEKEKELWEVKDELSKVERIEWLMNEYGQEVARLAFTYTKQKQLSEDISQEVFIKCYEKLDQFRHESSYKTWIYRITINLCKDRLRSWTFRNVVFTEFFSKWSKPVESTESLVMDGESRRIISEKVMNLPIKYREVIMLYYYEELTYNQIAEMLDMNIQTIKSRLHRARLLLKKMLEGSKKDG